LSEIKEVVETAEAKYCRNREGMITARIEVGPNDNQWSLKELKEIVAAIEEDGGPLLTASPLDRYDLERLGLQANLAPKQTVNMATGEPVAEKETPKKRGRPKKDVSGSETEDA
jgi:hypothetical protein